MVLWLKTPGESDGNCGVGAGSSAGKFLPDVAYKMIYGHQPELLPGWTSGHARS